MKKKFREYLKRIGIYNTHYSGKERIMYIYTDLDRIKVESYISLFIESLPFKIVLQ